MSDYRIVYRDELYHYGVKGMRWGVRRYQDESGRLTNAGEHRIAHFTEVNKELLKVLSEIEKRTTYF